jgi:hypothetical protein
VSCVLCAVCCVLCAVDSNTHVCFLPVLSLLRSSPKVKEFAFATKQLQFFHVFSNFAHRSYDSSEPPNGTSTRLPCPVLGLGSGNNITRMHLNNVVFG